MEEQQIQAYGKINLSLDVKRKRPDGYHDVCMVMQTVKLHDRIFLKREKTPGIRLSSNLDFLPTGEDNLMVKAARLLAEEFSIKEGLSFRLEKRIPVSGGMAGGSTDAAAVLHLMNQVYALGLSVKDLEKRGVKLGADVPFCLHRGCYLSEGIGEILTPLPNLPACILLLAKPAFSLSTKAVYEALNVSAIPKEEHPDVEKFLHFLKKGDLSEITPLMGNILEKVSIAIRPEIQVLKERLLSYGAEVALMSGSGPTVFALFPLEHKSRAEKAYQALRYGEDRHLAQQVYLTEPWAEEGGIDE